MAVGDIMILNNGKVFIDGIFQKKDINIREGIISEIGNFNENGIDCSDKFIIPGLVDIHTHGCAGYDFSSATPSEISVMQKYYLKNGITSILATTVSLGDDDIKNAVKNINTAAENNTDGADILGINLEGPYLSKSKCGAHDSNLLKEPDIEFVRSLGSSVKIVNVAPEYEKAFDFIKQFSGKVSIAHTACDYNTAVTAISLGADHITHIFNAMNGLHHREPGVIGAFFDTDAFAEMICDGIHVSAPLLRMMFRSYSDRIVIISDSMSATGLSDGKYKLGGLDVFVNDSVATLSDGTLAGSAMNVSDMMRNLIKSGIEPEKAIRSATEIPAKSIGIDNICGKIDENRRADIVILNSDYTVSDVIFGGKIIT